MARVRREQEKADEGQKFAPVAQAASPRLPNRAPQGPGLCHQQDPEEIQGPSGLRFSEPLLQGRPEIIDPGRFSFVIPAKRDWQRSSIRRTRILELPCRVHSQCFADKQGIEVLGAKSHSVGPRCGDPPLNL